MEKMFSNTGVDNKDNLAELVDENKNSVETNESAVEKELTLEEKKNLCQMWVDLVVDCEKMPEDIDDFSSEEVKEWLFQSLMHDTKRLLVEWDLEPDEMEIKKTALESDIDKKAELEKEYILSMHKKVSERLAFLKDSKGSYRWASWPKLMRKERGSKCAGASMLGVEILESAGIESYCGNPAGHVVNLAKLSNGDWWYVDFLNSSTQCKKINPEENYIENIPVLKIDDPAIDYRLVPYSDNREMSYLILNNLIAMDYEAHDNSIEDENEDKKYAQKYLSENTGTLMPAAEIKKMFKNMFEQNDKLNNSREMTAERIRIRELHGTQGDNPREFLHSLTDEEEGELKNEISEKIDLIEKTLREGGESLYASASKDLTRLVQLLIKEIDKRSGGDKEKRNSKVGEVLEKLNLYLKK